VTESTVEMSALSAIMRGGGRTPDELSALDPRYFEVAARLYSHPRRTGHLRPVEHALLEIALDSMVTQLDRQRLRASLHAGRAAGASVEEIVAVLEVVAVIGLHSATVGLPILFDADPTEERAFDDDEREVIAAIESDDPRPHSLSPMYASLLRRDRAYFENFIALIDHPWSAGVLTPRFIHLVCILIDVACSHLYEPGLRLHIRQALEHGSNAAEILEVIQLASATGLRSVHLGLDLLLDVLEEERQSVSDR
jgi:alkylhydroperoxidase/carboxymuconolactone decarboxylase family protein YurZ